MSDRTLHWQPALDRPDLLAPAVAEALKAHPDLTGIEVAEIDPDLADTAAFCAAYGIAPEESANCVVVAGRRGEATRYAACMVLATTRADVNGVVRRHLEAKKASFAPLADVEGATGMEFGGITPVGLPADWPVLVAGQVAAAGTVVIGSGLRGSKLRLPASALVALPGALVLGDLAR